MSEKFKMLITLPESKNRFAEGGLRLKGYVKKSLPNQPLVTIITAVFNGEAHLEETILSILKQDYENVEYIVIDGGSKDGTLNILRKYDDKIAYWISEQDKGISDAFNKGVTLALGDYINFQGDGDGIHHLSAISEMLHGIDKNKDLLVSGRIQRTSPEGANLYQSKYIKSFNKRSLLFRMPLPHQGLFTHVQFFKQYGLFDIYNTFCMDYEHLLRAYSNFPSVVTKDIVVANWRADGIGNGRTLEIFKEYDKIKRDHKVASETVLTFIKYWTLFKFYIKKGLRCFKF